MKKKLEAELISIAHRILKLKNKSELDQLHLEAQKLYEKLTVLKFVEENFEGIKPTIGKSEAHEILETAFDEPASAETPKAEEKPVAEVKSEVKSPEESTQTKAAESDSDKKPSEISEEESKDTPEEIKEPEAPKEEKLEEETEVTETNSENNLTDQTPQEKEVDEVIAEAENVSEDNKSEEKATETETHLETPVVSQGINFEEPESKHEVAAAITESVKESDLFKPTFEWAFEAKSEEIKESLKESPKSESPVAFDDLLGPSYVDPVFVKPEELAREGISYTADEMPTLKENEQNSAVIPISRKDDKIPVFKINNNEYADKSMSLNDRLSKGITVGLNDRIAFVKNLFNNSNEEYNRVLSQLITFNTFKEAEDFIGQMVKPDYNNWAGKEEYAERFMEIVEKKFS